MASRQGILYLPSSYLPSHPETLIFFSVFKAEILETENAPQPPNQKTTC